MRLGITGGIGSGKSFIATLFQALEIPVYNADVQAKLIMERNPILRSRIIQTFGDEAYVQNGLNRIYLAKKVFSNPPELFRLNSIVHPFVKDDFLEWGKSIHNQHYGIESAILIESGFHTLVDKVLLVTASINTKLSRIQHRDNLSEAQALSRMSAQWSDEDKQPYAHYIIHNDDHQALLPQIEQIISTLK